MPSFWRDEIFHPLTVHFPVAFLSAALAAHLLAALFFRAPTVRKSLEFLRDTMLTIGTACGWLAVVTGEWAEDVVNRVICDPTITNAHEDLAKLSLYFFTAGILLMALRRWKPSLVARAIFWLAELGVLSVAAFYLLQAGHLGAQLVYQQGAGVYHPSEECREFE